MIITRDRAGELARTLRRLTSLPEQVPIVVVDNGSDDGTARMVRSAFPGVDVVALGSNHGAVGRNIGVDMCSTPFVAFCDDDTWWSPGSLTAAAEILAAHPRLAVVTARIVVEPDGYLDPICTETDASPLPVRAGCPVRLC